MRDPLNDLLHSMKTTKGSRFNASSRLVGRDRQMALVVALASAIVIALTVIPFVYKLPSLLVSDLSALTLVMSVLILAVSLIQYSNDDAVIAEQHHLCGLELNELRRELSAKSASITAVEIEKYGHKYDQILKKYRANHDGVDYDRYRIQHPSEFEEFQKNGKVKISFILLKIWAKSLWPNILMITVLGLFVFMIVWRIIPDQVQALDVPADQDYI
ncbi:MAG: SLATT domain-containing protein [Alphaproteobacteria bacterium]|nr:SLATT domain-containing protein [Alphaproteobacteria bacterium]